MQSIISYFNVFIEVLFGSPASSINNLRLMAPSTVILEVHGIISSSLASSSPFEYFLLKVIDYPSIIFSAFVWTWFAWLTIHLLLIWPFNWLRSIIRKCRG